MKQPVNKLSDWHNQKDNYARLYFSFPLRGTEKLEEGLKDGFINVFEKVYSYHLNYYLERSETGLRSEKDFLTDTLDKFTGEYSYKTAYTENYKDLIRRWVEFLTNKQISKKQHRERAIAHNYKVDAGLAKKLTRPEMRTHGGKKFEQAFDSLNKMTKSKTNPYREATSKELETVVKLLADFPEAQKAAINDLSKME